MLTAGGACSQYSRLLRVRGREMLALWREYGDKWKAQLRRYQDLNVHRQRAFAHRIVLQSEASRSTWWQSLTLSMPKQWATVDTRTRSTSAVPEISLAAAPRSADGS
jgi:hypothetical protein